MVFITLNPEPNPQPNTRIPEPSAPDLSAPNPEYATLRTQT